MQLPLEDLASMALFARVVQARSFSEAARRSGMAKSAVSKRVAQLEAHLGVRLLVRTTRKLALTPEGLQFYEHCSRLVDAAEAASESVSGAGSEPRGPVSVSAPVTFAQMHLAAPVASFLQKHPEIQLSVATDNRAVDLVEGGFDVVIRIARLAETSFVSRKLAEDRLIVVGAPAYFALRGEPATPEELVGHNCLHYSLVPRQGEWRFRGPDGAFGVPAAGNFSTSDGSLLREVAIAGLGLAVVPSFMVARDVREGRLRAVLDEDRRGRVGIHALFAARRQLPLRTRLFVDHLARHFARPDWVGQGAAR